ncbi:reverse integrase domain protein, partial [Cystoisospora suis]
KVTPRLGKWLDKLAEFNLEIKYKPGSANVVADGLSRRQDYVNVITRSAARAQREQEEAGNTADSETEVEADQTEANVEAEKPTIPSLTEYKKILQEAYPRST